MLRTIVRDCELKMTPDEASTIQTVCIAIQTVFIPVTLWLASRESKKWRTQLIGAKKIDLAYEVDSALRLVNHNLVKVRNFADLERTEQNSQVQQMADRTLTELTDSLFKLHLVISRVDIEYQNELFDGYDYLTLLCSKLIKIWYKVLNGEKLSTEDAALLNGSGADSDFIVTITKGALPFHIFLEKVGK